MFRQKSSKLLLALFVVSASSFIAQLATATVMSFTVHVHEEVTRILNLAVDDHVSIGLTTVSRENRGILDFWVTFPNGTIKISYGNVGGVRYDFVCEVAGEYTLHFANVGQSEDVLTSLNYDVGHYILGIPQTLFLMITIAVVCVFAIAVFVLTGKR